MDADVDILAGYRVLQRLDAGGDVAFFRAKDPATGLLKMVVRIPTTIAEVRWPPWCLPDLAQTLIDPRIVRLMNVVRTREWACLVLEYVPGAQLREVAPQGLLSISEALFVVHEALCALDTAHHHVLPSGQDCSYLHEHLSPRTILISREGQVKVQGFGLGVLKPESIQPVEDLDAPLSSDLWSYMTPDTALGRETTAASDLGRLGLVLHWMLTGERYFDGESARERILAIARNQRRPAQKLELRLPKPLLELRDRLVAISGPKRFRGAKEAARSVRDLADLLGVGLSPEELKVRMQASSHGR